MDVKIITLNVNGLRLPNKRLSFLQWLSNLSAGIVCLQEVHASTVSEAQSWFSSYGFQVAYSPGTALSCGSVILFRSIFHLCNVWNDSEGRFVLCEFSFRDCTFRVCSAYAPNRNPDRDEFFDFVVDSVDPSVPTIMCGDFNAVFDRSVDRRGSSLLSTHRDSSQTLANLFRECCVLDAWRVLHPSTPGFTWDKPDGSLSSRIDLVGCPYSWASSMSSCDIHPCPFSDHSALVFISYIPDAIPRGPGRWHLNISILDDPDFITLISDFWSRWQGRKLSFPSISVWWDLGKSKVKGLSINYCKEKSRERHSSRSLLTNLASHLKLRIDSGVVSCIEVYHNVLAQISTIMDKSVETFCQTNAFKLTITLFF